MFACGPDGTGSNGEEALVGRWNGDLGPSGTVVERPTVIEYQADHTLSFDTTTLEAVPGQWQISGAILDMTCSKEAIVCPIAKGPGGLSVYYTVDRTTLTWKFGDNTTWTFHRAQASGASM